MPNPSTLERDMLLEEELAEGDLKKHPFLPIYSTTTGELYDREGEPLELYVGRKTLVAKYKITEKSRVRIRQKNVPLIVWETFRGKLPKGCFIDFADNNALNNSINNLVSTMDRPDHRRPSYTPTPPKRPPIQPSLTEAPKFILRKKTPRTGEIR